MPDCDKANLKFATWLTLGIHGVTLLLMVMQHLGLSFVMKKMPLVLLAFDLYVVMVMFLVQYFIYDSVECYSQSTALYVWLCAQVAVFYLGVTVGLSLWARTLCEDPKKKIYREFKEKQPQTTEHLL